jgi:hypothetical protein
MNDPTIGDAGVDWAMDAHAVCVVDGHGAAVAEFDVEHSGSGLAEMCRRIKHAGAGRVAIERPDGPVVDALLHAELEVVVVSSRSVKALRERYGTSGNKSDRSDAYVLADCLRTDGHRWRSLELDSPATVTLRGHVRARKDLVETRVAVADQLRAHLRIVFPGAVGLFSAIDSPISLRFLEPMADFAQRRAGSLATTVMLAGRSRSPTSTCPPPREPKSTSSPPDSMNSSTPTPTPTSTGRCHAARPCAPQRCSPRSAIVAPGSPTPNRCAVSQASPHPPEPADDTAPSPSDGQPTRNSATHSATSPATAGKATPGPPTATTNSAPTAKTTPTHPRTQLGPHHLALLARPHRLRPHPPRQPPTPHPTRRLT